MSRIPNTCHRGWEWTDMSSLNIWPRNSREGGGDVGVWVYYTSPHPEPFYSWPMFNFLVVLRSGIKNFGSEYGILKEKQNFTVNFVKNTLKRLPCIPKIFLQSTIYLLPCRGISTLHFQGTSDCFFMCLCLKIGSPRNGSVDPEFWFRSGNNHYKPTGHSIRKRWHRTQSFMYNNISVCFMGEREKDFDTLNFVSSRDILDKGDKITRYRTQMKRLYLWSPSQNHKIMTLQTGNDRFLKKQSHEMCFFLIAI